MGGGSCHAKSGPQPFLVSQVSTDSKYASIIHNGEQAKARITSEIPPGFPNVQGSMGGGSCHAKSGPQSFLVRQVSTDSKYVNIIHNVEQAKARITSEIPPGFPDVQGSIGGSSCYAKSSQPFVAVSKKVCRANTLAYWHDGPKVPHGGAFKTSRTLVMDNDALAFLLPPFFSRDAPVPGESLTFQSGSFPPGESTA